MSNKATALSIIRKVDTELSKTSLDGWNELSNNVADLKSKISINPLWFALAEIIESYLRTFKKIYFKDDGTKKRSSIIRIIKVSGLTLLTLTRIYFLIFKPRA